MAATPDTTEKEKISLGADVQGENNAKVSDVSDNVAAVKEIPDSGSFDTLARSVSPLWHPADRDWRMYGTIVDFLILLTVISLFLTDVLRNIMMIAFFIVFISFLLLVSGYLFYKSIQLKEYQAAYLGHGVNPPDFINTLQDKLSDEFGEPEEVESISGHTFGLLHPIKSMRLTDDEIIDINEVHISNSGIILGMYLLVKAPGDSKLWPVLDGIIRR